MGRSVKKGPYVEESLLVKIQALNDKNEKKVFKTWSRRSTITPDFVGHTLAVHNGNRSEEHTSELQSRRDLVCRLLLEKKKKKKPTTTHATLHPPAVRPVFTEDEL